MPKYPPPTEGDNYILNGRIIWWRRPSYICMYQYEYFVTQHYNTKQWWLCYNINFSIYR